eukprot:128367_1
MAAAANITSTLQQYGEDDVDESMPFQSGYRPSNSTGVFGSYVLIEPPKCIICLCETYAQHSVTLECCGVVLHNQCFKSLIESKMKPGHRTCLLELSCAHCRKRMKVMKHTQSAELLSRLDSSYEKLVQVALEQLQIDEKFQDKELMEEKSEFYENPKGYAMKLYSFRNCYHCGQPYCSGVQGSDKDEWFNPCSSELTKHCCSRECAFQTAKLFYKQHGKPLIRDKHRALADIKKNAANYKNVALPLVLGQDKPFNEWDEDAFKREFSTKFKIPIECICINSVTAGSRIIDLRLETHLNGQELLMPIECIAEKISGDKALKEFVEFSIFAMEFGLPKAGFVPLKQRVIMNPRWNRAYGRGHTTWTGALSDGKSRGNEPYYCPVGWKRFAVQFSQNAYDFANVYDDWPIAYHGTKFGFGMMIALTGLMCNGGDHGDGVYLSPSIKYVTHPRYAKPVKFDLNKARRKQWTQDHINEFRKYDGKYIQCAFMCRVKPGAYIKRKETMAYWTDFPHKNGVFDNIDINEIEWIVKGKKGEIIETDKILIYGIMIRACNKNTTGYEDAQAEDPDDKGCILM